MTKALIESGIDVNRKEDNHDFTALHVAVENFKDTTEFVKMLLENGADINLQTKFGDAVLHLATKNSKITYFGKFFNFQLKVNLRRKIAFKIRF